MSILKQAIERMGGQTKLARAVSEKAGGAVVTPQILQGWIKRDRVPEHMVWPFARATGFSPWEIRPDLYDRPEVYLYKVAQVVAEEAVRL